MNKAALAEAVQKVLGGTKVQAEQVIDTVFDSIVGSLKKGNEVSIAGSRHLFRKGKSRTTGAKSKNGRIHLRSGDESAEVQSSKSFEGRGKISFCILYVQQKITLG